MVVPCFGALSVLSQTVAPEQTTAQAASNYGTIRVRVTVADGLTSYSFKLAGNYQLAEKPSLKLPDGQYTVTSNGSQLTLKLPNGSSYGVGSQITLIECQNAQKSFITMTGTHAGTQRYRGDVIFYIDNGIRVVSRVPMEIYLMGVIRGEMGAGFPLEALKAQTVAARGYAIKKLQAGTKVHYDITDTASDQVYKGYVANERTEKVIIDAVEGTKGKVLTYGGSIITAYYGATNGGQTELAGNAWSQNFAYLKQKDDPYDLRFKGNEQLFFVPSNIVGTKYDVAGGGTGERVRINGDGVNVRKGPGTNYDSLGQVNTGTVLPYLGMENGWYKVTYNGQTGYVIERYGEKLDASSGSGLPYEYDQLHMQELQKLAYEYLKAKGYNVPAQTNVRLLACNYLKGKDKFYPTTASRCYKTGGASLKVQYVDGEGNLHDNIDNVVVTVKLQNSMSDRAHPYFNATYRMRGAEAGTEDGISGYYWTNRRYGHGVGMSQRGAQYRALAGQTYEQILGFYYEGATLTTVDTKAPDLPTTAGVQVVQIQNVNEFANVRSDPSTNHAPIGTAKKDEWLPLIKVENGWCQVNYGTRTGYIDERFCLIIRMDELPAEEETVYIDSDYLNVRSGPDATYTQLGTVTSGTRLPYYATENGWFKVLYNGNVGYVSGKGYARRMGEQWSPGVMQVAIVGTQVLNVRRTPSAAGSMIGAAYLNQRYDYLGQADNGWYRIEFGNEVGYISDKYATTVYPELEPPAQTVQVILTDGMLNIRSGPGAEYEMLGAASRHQQFPYLGTMANGWHKINYNGQEGYISGKYAHVFGSIVELEPVPTPTATPTPTPTIPPQPTPSEPIDPEKDGALVVQIVDTDVLNVRSEANPESEMLGAVYRDQIYPVYGQAENGWYFISYGTTLGYVSNKYSVLGYLPVDRNQTLEIVDTDILNVRSGPGVEYPMVGYTTRASRYAYYGQDPQSGWYMINFDGVIGYVSGKYVNVHTATPTATPTPTTAPTATPSPTPKPTATPQPTATPTPGTGEGYKMVRLKDTSVLNVRSTPSADGKMMGAIYEGQTYDWYGTDAATGWHKINFNGQMGYVSGKYIDVYTLAPLDGYEVKIEGTEILNVRMGPSADSPMIGSTTGGSTFAYYETDATSGWHKINFNGMAGYVSRKYSKLSKDGVVQAFVQVVNVNESANVRSGPSTDDKVLGQALKGQYFRVLEQLEGWYKISYRGQDAYLSATCAQLQ